MAKILFSSVNCLLFWNRLYPLDSYKNLNSEQSIGIQSFWFWTAETWIIELLNKTKKIVWLVDWNILSSSSNRIHFSAQLND